MAEMRNIINVAPISVGVGTMTTTLLNSVYGLALVAYLSAAVPLLVLLIQNRNVQPVLHRGWILTSIATLGGIMMFTVVCFRQPDPSNFPCSIYVLAANLFFSLFFLPYIFRCGRIIYIQYVALKPSDDDRGKRYRYEKSKWFSNRCMVAIYMVGFLFSVFVAFWMIYYIGRTGDGITVLEHDDGNNNNVTTTAVVSDSDDNAAAVNGTKKRNVAEEPTTTPHPVNMMKIGCEFGGEFVPFAIVSMGYILAFMVCYVMLRRVAEDEFGVCRELKRCLLIWIPMTFLFFFCNMWEPIFWLDAYLPFSTFILMLIVGTNIVSLLQPIMQTYSPHTGIAMQHMTERSQVTHYTTVENIMKDRQARSIFEDWIRQARNQRLRHLDFLKDVRVYRSVQDEQQRWPLSKRIKDQYLDRDALLSVYEDIVPQNMQVFQRIYEGCTVTHTAPTSMFNSLYDDIVACLQRDCMEEFIKSRNYQDLASITSRYHANLAAYHDQGLLDPV